MIADIVDIISLFLSGLAIFVAATQHLSDRNRSRKEATIHAFDTLEKEVFSKKTYKDLVFQEGLDFAVNSKDTDDITAWNEATLALSQIEHFAVGVNSKIYDLKTLDRMAGSFITAEYLRWTPIINTKRMQFPEHKQYEEFEHLCHRLEKMRRRKLFLSAFQAKKQYIKIQKHS